MSCGSKRAVAITALALLFFADIFLIYISKTGMLAAVALLGLFLVWLGGWRRAGLRIRVERRSTAHGE